MWGQRDVYGPQLPPLRPEQRVQTLRCTIWTLQQVCCAVSAWRGEVMRGPRGSPFHSSPSSWNTEGGQGRERRVGGMAQEQEGVVGCPGLHQGGQVLGRACGTHFGSGCAHSPPWGPCQARPVPHSSLQGSGAPGSVALELPLAALPRSRSSAGWAGLRAGATWATLPGRGFSQPPATASPVWVRGPRLPASLQQPQTPCAELVNRLCPRRRWKSLTMPPGPGPQRRQRIQLTREGHLLTGLTPCSQRRGTPWSPDLAPCPPTNGQSTVTLLDISPGFLH